MSKTSLLAMVLRGEKYLTELSQLFNLWYYRASSKDIRTRKTKLVSDVQYIDQKRVSAWSLLDNIEWKNFNIKVNHRGCLSWSTPHIQHSSQVEPYFYINFRCACYLFTYTAIWMSKLTSATAYSKSLENHVYLADKSDRVSTSSFSKSSKHRPHYHLQQSLDTWELYALL